MHTVLPTRTRAQIEDSAADKIHLFGEFGDFLGAMTCNLNIMFSSDIFTIYFKLKTDIYNPYVATHPYTVPFVTQSFKTNTEHFKVELRQF